MRLLRLYVGKWQGVSISLVKKYINALFEGDLEFFWNDGNFRRWYWSKGRRKKCRSKRKWNKWRIQRRKFIIRKEAGGIEWWRKKTWKGGVAGEGVGTKMKDSKGERQRQKVRAKCPPYSFGFLSVSTHSHLTSWNPLSLRGHSLFNFPFHLSFQYTFYTAVQTFQNANLIMFPSHIYSCSDSTRAP